MCIRDRCNLWILHADNMLHIDRTHLSKLYKMLSSGIHIGTTAVSYTHLKLLVSALYKLLKDSLAIIKELLILNISHDKPKHKLLSLIHIFRLAEILSRLLTLALT